MPNDSKTIEDLIRDLKQKLYTDMDRAGASHLVGDIINRRIEEAVYASNEYAKLGRHVEAIMKYFKEV